MQTDTRPGLSRRDAITVKVRWGLKADMPAVREIERLSFGTSAWGDAYFGKLLERRDVVLLVAEYRTRVVGFIVYQLLPDRLRLLNLAVHPFWRRCGAGAQLAGRIQDRLGTRRPALEVEIRESNLGACRFLARCGFRAVEILRGAARDPDEDTYRFEYRIGGDARRGA